MQNKINTNMCKMKSGAEKPIGLSVMLLLAVLGLLVSGIGKAYYRARIK